MAINYWVHDCVASEELAQNGKMIPYCDAKLIRFKHYKPNQKGRNSQYLMFIFRKPFKY